MEYPGRIVAIDYGSKRVGVAASDPMRIISQGIETLENNESLMFRLTSIVKELGATLIIVGMPYSDNGGKGTKAIEVDGFILELQKNTELPIETWDESLTSVEAKRLFLEIGMKKKKRQEKHRVDVMAARVLLQDYLSHKT